MPTSVTFLSAQGLPLLELSHQSLRGDGRVHPRLLFTFEARIVPDPRHPSELEVDVSRLRAEVMCGAELLGNGEARELGAPISIHSNGHVQLDVPISAAAVRYVEEQARGDDVTLRITFQTVLRHRRPAMTTPSGGVQAAAEQWTEVRHGSNVLPDLVIPRSDWVRKVVEPLGTYRYIWMELPLPPLPDSSEWDTALSHLKQAEVRDHEGIDHDVLRSCYDAFSALSPSNAKAIIPAIADQAKRDQVDAILHEFRGFLQGGRHPQKVGPDAGRYNADHRDAQFALAMTKVWLTYIARLQAGS